ncbi:MAG: prepilin-type N-terminal cleavage/methylation domain-containing protein [Planctomycetota bacterium]
MIHRFARPRGFTLVELLVVIGIIALLVSILLPSLVRARQSAGEVKCLSNVRQLVAASALYANDNSGSLISWSWNMPHGSTRPGNDWTSTLSKYVGYVGYNGEDQWLQYGVPLGTDPALKNKEIEIYQCPTDAAARENFDDEWQIRRPVTYVVPFVVGSDVPSWYHPVVPKLTNFNAVEFPLFVDGIGGGGALPGFQFFFRGIHDEGKFASEPDFVDTNIAFRHGPQSGDDGSGLYYRSPKGRANVAFLDGHAMSVVRTEFPSHAMTRENRDAIQRIRAN